MLNYPINHWLLEPIQSRESAVLWDVQQVIIGRSSHLYCHFAPFSANFFFYFDICTWSAFNYLKLSANCVPAYSENILQIFAFAKDIHHCLCDDLAGVACKVLCGGGVTADKNPRQRHPEKATNRVIVLQFIENIEGVTSVIFKSHKSIYQFRWKNGLL